MLLMLVARGLRLSTLSKLQLAERERLDLKSVAELHVSQVQRGVGIEELWRKVVRIA